MDKVLKYVFPGVSVLVAAGGFYLGSLDEQTAGAIIAAGLAPLGFKAFGPQILEIVKGFKKPKAEDKK